MQDKNMNFCKKCKNRKLYTHQKEYFEDLWVFFEKVNGVYCQNDLDRTLAHSVSWDKSEKYIDSKRGEMVHEFYGFFLGYTYANREEMLMRGRE